MSSIATFGNPSCGLTRTLSGVAYEEGIARTHKALKVQGFGILTEIDIKATLAATIR